MGDLSCQGPPPYTPAPLVCEAPPPPESLVCEAPPPVSKALAPAPPARKAPQPTPPADRLQTPPPAGRSQQAHIFLDEAQQVCIDPAKAALPLRQHPGQPVPASRFSSSLDNSLVLAELQLQATDRDGLLQRSQGDLSGVIERGQIALNQQLFLPALQKLAHTQSHDAATNTTTEIRDIRFDPGDQAYVVQLKVSKKFELPLLPDPKIWDHFELRFKGNAQGELVAELNKNWLPDARILSQVEQKVRQSLKQHLPPEHQVLQLKTRQQGHQLQLQPQLQNLQVPLGDQGSLRIDQIASEQARLHFDKQGHLHLQLEQVAFTGSTSQTAAQTTGAAPAQKPPDSLRLEAKVALKPDQRREAYARGQLTSHLDAEQTAQVQLGHDKLSDFMRSGRLQSDFSLHLEQQGSLPPVLESQQQLQIRQADLGAGQPVDLDTHLQLSLDPVSGLQLRVPEYDYAPLQPDFQSGGLSLKLNSAEYYPELKQLLSSARESIDLETFMYTDDEVGRELAGILARKAAGLNAEGPLRPNPESPDGVAVRFLFNSWKGNAADGAASERMLQEAKARLAEELAQSPLSPTQRQQALQQLEQNLNWHFFSEGILRSDHRKVLVVDGQQATVGGMNLGKNYLGEAAYRDLMIKVAGPEVRRIHEAFLDNWEDLSGQTADRAALRSPSELQADLARRQAAGEYSGSAQVQTLLTDDRQIDIERGLVQLIDSAEHEIYLQQAFFSDQTVQRHLSAAIERGVKIHVLVAENPLAESVFSAANLLSVYELAQQQLQGAPGEVQLHYFSHPEGGSRSQIHSKALSVDGQRALVGSANLIGRSLSSPFVQRGPDGQVSQAMYNKEIALLIDDPDFVQELNQRLFQHDITHQSRPLDAAAIEAEVQRRGGESQLRKAALPAPFT